MSRSQRRGLGPWEQMAVHSTEPMAEKGKWLAGILSRTFDGRFLRDAGAGRENTRRRFYQHPP